MPAIPTSHGLPAPEPETIEPETMAGVPGPSSVAEVLASEGFDDDVRELALPAALLCDMDGTLVDTEPEWWAAEVELMAAHGFVLEDAERARMIGTPILKACARLLEISGIPLTVEELHTALNQAMVDRIVRGVRFLPGARELLEEARAAHVPMALVTASENVIVDAVLAGLGRHWFGAIVTGEDVRHGKPAPDPYLLAAAHLGVDPAACVVVEDSPTGIASARAAGCRVVGVAPLVPVEPAPRLRVLSTLAGVDLAALSTGW